MALRVLWENLNLIFIGLLLLLTGVILSGIYTDTSVATRQVLGAEFYIENGYWRNSFINDNHNRCQNKLGLSMGVFQQYDQDFRNRVDNIFNDGGRWIQILVEAETVEEANALADQLGDAVAYANRKSVTPVLRFGGLDQYFRGGMPDRTGGAPFSEASNYDGGQAAERIVNFINRISAHPDVAEYDRFVIEAAPTTFMEDGGEIGFARAALISADVREGVSKVENPNKNVLLTNPAFTYNTICTEDTHGTSCINLSEQFRLYYQGLSFDSRFSQYVEDASYDLFDFIMIEGQNFDKEFMVDVENHDPAKMLYNILDKGGPLDLARRMEEEDDIFMRLIVVEYGLGFETEVETVDIVSARLGQDFGLMSDSPYIEAIIFGEAIGAYTSQKNTLLSEMNLYGTNCIYDIVDYNYQFAENSTASVCKTTTVDSGSQNRFKYICDNSGFCTASAVYTLQIGLPIRHAGSNSAVGTATNTYMPPLVKAIGGANPRYDYINQIGSRLEGGSAEYVVPWLGNYLSISNALNPLGVKSISPSSAVNDLSAGLYVSNTTREDQIDQQKRKIKKEGSTVQVRDEEAIFYSPFVGVSKEIVNTVDALGVYEIGSDVGYTGVNACSGAEYVQRNPQNMIYGSEQIVKTTTEEVHANILAYRFIRGEIEGSIEYRLNPGNNCRCASGAFLTESGLRSGLCELTGTQVVDNNCVQYLGGADTLKTSGSFITESFPSIDRYEIPGAYDSLAAMYNYIQSYMMSSGKKIIFNRELGWEADLILRAYANADDYGSSFSLSGAASRPNNMLETINSDFDPIVDFSERTDWPTPEVEDIVNSIDDPTCTIGINFAVEVNEMSDQIKRATEDGFCKALGIAYGSEYSRGMVDYVAESCSMGLSPVIRATCRDGVGSDDCFNGGRGNFIAGVLNDQAVIQACDGKTVYAICGGNEPFSEYGGNITLDAQETKECIDRVNRGNYNFDLRTISSPLNGARDNPDVTKGNMGQYITAYRSAGGDFNNDFSCFGINTYANSPSGAPVTNNLDAISQKLAEEGINLPLCITETGFAFPASSEQSTAETPRVVSDILSNKERYNIEFALGFNWYGDNGDERFAKYSVNRDTLKSVAQGVSTTTGGSSNIRFNIEGEYMSNYNSFPAADDFMKRERHYYPWLGTVDTISKYLDVLAESQVSFQLTQAMVNLPNCGSAVDEDSNCLTDFGLPGSDVYEPDPLGTFLCSKGYDVVTGECNLDFCEADISEIGTDLGLSELRNATCPISNDRCWQSPLGTVTHACAFGAEVGNMNVAAFDFYPNGPDNTVFAPEDGRIVYAASNEYFSCIYDYNELISINQSRNNPGNSIAILQGPQGIERYKSAGGWIGYMGNSGVYYRMTHIDLTEAQMNALNQEKPNYTGGDALNINGQALRLYQMPDDIYTPCWRGQHLDIKAKIGVTEEDAARGGRNTGQWVDPYQVFGALGCSSINSCDRPDGTCSVEWASFDGATGNNICPTPDISVGSTVGQSCNEFGVLPGNPRYESFINSLEGAAKTLASRIYRCDAGRPSVDRYLQAQYDTYCVGDGALGYVPLSSILNDYGPYCDTETRGANSDLTTTMPFGYAWVSFFNQVSDITCEAPPQLVRSVDVGKVCTDFGSRFEIHNPDNPAFEYYRGVLEGCLSKSQMTWTGGMSGKSVDQAIDELYQVTISYSYASGGDRFSFGEGPYGDPVPREKIELMFQAARKEGINPYLLIPIWGTESRFGKAFPGCNTAAIL